MGASLTGPVLVCPQSNQSNLAADALEGKPPGCWLVSDWGPAGSPSHSSCSNSSLFLPSKLRCFEAPVGCCEIAGARVKDHGSPAGSNYLLPGAVPVLALQSVPEGAAPADGVMIPPLHMELSATCTHSMHKGNASVPEQSACTDTCMVLLAEAGRVQDTCGWAAGTRWALHHDPSLWSASASGASGHMARLHHRRQP